MKPISITTLRSNIYAVIDGALQSGDPLRIKRRGKVVWLVPHPHDVPVRFVRKMGHGERKVVKLK